MTRPIWRGAEPPEGFEVVELEDGTTYPALAEECVVSGTVVGAVVQFYADGACYGEVNGVRLGAMASVAAAKAEVEGRCAQRAN